MATGDSKAKAPNFYENAAAMSMPGAGAAPPAAGADKGEKSKNVAALLEVVQRIDGIEQDPELKKLTQQIVSITQQYMDKLGGGKAPTEGAAPAPAPTSDGAAGGAAAAGAGAGAAPVPA